MGQYRHQMFVCTSGKLRPLDGSRAVHAALEKAVNKLVKGDSAP